MVSFHYPENFKTNITVNIIYLKDFIDLKLRNIYSKLGFLEKKDFKLMSLVVIFL